MTTTTPRPPRIKPAKTMPAEDLRRIEDYVRTSVPDKHKLATLRALTGQMGKALALKQKCLQCAGYQRKEVELCPVITCALHPVRPYQSNDSDDGTDV